MLLAMELHKKGWQVYRAYIDENVDFVIAKYYCKKCKKTTKLHKHTDKCDTCGEGKVDFFVRFIQVKTSEGVPHCKEGVRSYSFHAKLRSNIGKNSFYAWIAVTEDKEGNKMPHFYIFHHTEINKFDNLSLPSYRITDNQKTTLHIRYDGSVLNKGIKYSYDCFKEFHNNFDKLENRKAKR